MVKPKKRLGQHFLVSRHVALFFVRAAEVSKHDTVLEIGPGKGIITRELAKRAKKVYAIEVDKELAPYLRIPNVEVIWGDALKLSWPEHDKVVANLPFNIASQVLLKITKPAVLGVQKELALRLTAEPGSENYSRISVVAQFLFDIEVLKHFPPQVFYPVPKVWLSVIRLKPKEKPGNWEELNEFIRKLFMHAKKTVKNALKAHGISYSGKFAERKVRSLSKEEVLELFEEVTGK